MPKLAERRAQKVVLWQLQSNTWGVVQPCCLNVLVLSLIIITTIQACLALDSSRLCQRFMTLKMFFVL